MTSRIDAVLPPLPCPFCGHVGLDFSPEGGSTFRWMAWACGGCGIGSEVRVVRTFWPTDEATGLPSRDAVHVAEEEAIEAAKHRAINDWNTRAPAIREREKQSAGASDTAHGEKS